LLKHSDLIESTKRPPHGRNIIHRDLKPANVIMGDFGETVVIDWGLAKDLTVGEESSASDGPLRITRDDDLTATGSVIGTPAHTPPEQRRGEQVDQHADVFAISAMLWELCALQRTPPASAIRVGVSFAARASTAIWSRSSTRRSIRTRRALPRRRRAGRRPQDSHQRR
jgi:serine/threonine protein kinase